MPPRSLADPLYERLLRSFPADQAYTSADWEADPMPDPVRHYLEHLLRHHSRREARRLRRARTDWVDYDHPEMEQAVRTFFETVETHTQVPRDQWADTLRTATHRTTAHLVRPVPTLTSFVFDEHIDSVPVSQVLWRMQFFGPYAYLREAVETFVKNRERETLERDEFERVLRRVDERTTSDFDADRWLDLLDPLFDVARRATGREQVSLSLLHTFFEEKNASSVAHHLTTHEPANEADAVAPDTLRRLIEAATTPSPSPERPESAEPPPGADLRALDEAVRSPDPEASPADEEANEATPLWKQFQHGRPRRHRETGDETEAGPQPLWSQFRQNRSVTNTVSESTSPSESSPSRSTPEDAPVAPEREDDLSSLEREVLGTGHPSHRTVYIQKLFQGDEAAYQRVLERLRTIESWSEASQIIARDIFRANKVNIYSDAAVHFTDAVEASFRE